MIEVGRHQGKDRHERYCPFCPNHVETEFHFLFHCPIYRSQREEFITPITNRIHNFSFLPENQKLELILCSMDEDVCKFISISTEIREFLVNNPRECC